MHSKHGINGSQKSEKTRRTKFQEGALEIPAQMYSMTIAGDGGGFIVFQLNRFNTNSYFTLKHKNCVRGCFMCTLITM